jgi:hypothetical protein
MRVPDVRTCRGTIERCVGRLAVTEMEQSSKRAELCKSAAMGGRLPRQMGVHTNTVHSVRQRCQRVCQTVCKTSCLTYSSTNARATAIRVLK